MRLLLALLVVLIFLLVLCSNRSRFLHAWLQGAWEGDRAFCDEAGVGGMLLYVGPWGSYADGGSTVQGWRSFLLVYDAETVLHAQVVYLQLGSVLSPGALLGLVAPVSASLHLAPGEKYLESSLPLEDLMPADLSCYMDPVGGVLEWLDSETSYARFHKVPS